MTDFELIASSATFAATAHGQQKRKELNDPYIVHPLRVASAAARFRLRPNVIAACNLHDVLEDTTIPESTLRNHFPAETVDLVVLVSKWWPDGLPPATEAANKLA